MEDTLFGMGSRLLELIKSTFTAAGLTLPDRQLVYMSPIPADCEQVAVLTSGWDVYPGGEGPQQCITFRWMANFSIIVTRCTPAMPTSRSGKVTIPSVEKMESAMETASKDAEALLQVVVALEEVSAPSIIVQSPSGGFQTVELNVQIPAGRV